MSEPIPGRDLIQYGRFSANWNTVWTHDGTGAAVTVSDPTYGAFLMTNGLAEVTQDISLPDFTEAQMPRVTPRVAFQYENYNEGPGAGVLITTSKGVEFSIDLSGKTTKANWNPYPFNAIKGVTAADTSLGATVKAPDISGSSGLRITDIKVDLLLVPLKLNAIQLDEKVYEQSA